MAWTPVAPIGTKAGHVISRLGGVASRSTVRQPAPDVADVVAHRPQTVCAPLSVNVCGAGIDAASTPLPGLPSASVGSPAEETDTLTLSLYQPPPPA